MNRFQVYPGTPQHQRLMEAIVTYYANDSRILAVIVFGSLGRGNWDHYSDLDLDVVIADDVNINVTHELERLSDSFSDIGEHAAIIIPEGEDAGNIVLKSLMGISIRYHSLHSTSPNIVDSMVVLTGQIDEAIIKAAGKANKQVKDVPLSRLLDSDVRYAVETDRAIQRQQIWLAIEIEHHMRGLLVELFARTHGGLRPIHTFQKEADASLQSLMGSTLPQFDLPSVQRVLIRFIDILEQDLGHFTADQIRLTKAHLQILGLIRARQAKVSLKDT